MNNSTASFHLPLFKARYFSVGPRSVVANPPRPLRLCGKNILTAERPKSPSPFPLSAFRLQLFLNLILILISTTALAPSRGLANPPILIAGDGTYLGVVSANEFDPESTSNPFGLYGSAYSATSIANPFSLYGSEYSADSANNPYVVSDPLEK